VHPLALLQTVFPLFPSDLPLAPSVRSLLADSVDGRDPLLASLYLGAAAIPLVLAALGSGRRRECVALVVLLAVALTLALGRHHIAYFWIVDTFPVLDLFRFPAKAMVLVSLAFALLGGLGLEAWGRLSRRSTVLTATTTALVAIAL